MVDHILLNLSAIKSAAVVRRWQKANHHHRRRHHHHHTGRGSCCTSKTSCPVSLLLFRPREFRRIRICWTPYKIFETFMKRFRIVYRGLVSFICSFNSRPLEKRWTNNIFSVCRWNEMVLSFNLYTPQIVSFSTHTFVVVVVASHAIFATTTTTTRPKWICHYISERALALLKSLKVIKMSEKQ